MFERTEKVGGLETLESRQMLSVKVSDLGVGSDDFVGYLGSDSSAGIVVSASGTLHRMDPSTGATSPFFTPLSEGLRLSFRDDFVHTLGNRAMFTATDGTGDVQLWATDGTRPGTRLLRAFEATGGGPNYLGERNGQVYFGADDGVSGSELWATDGTPAGTRLIANINPGGGSSPEAVVDYGSWLTAGVPLMFVAEDGQNGRELWVTDGTTAGTRLVGNINRFGDSSINGLGTVGGRVFFAADDGVNGSELWVSDGTTAGTSLVMDLIAGPGQPGLSDSGNFSVNGRMLFAVGERRALWASDGTVAGTIELTSQAVVEMLGVVNGKMLFATPSGLWSTDGTPQGTSSFLADATIGENISGLNPWLFDLRSRTALYFSTVSSFESPAYIAHSIWRTDGTGAGTVRIARVEVSGTGGTPVNTFARDTSGRLYFGMPDGSLRSTDGTADGTTVLATNFGRPVSVGSQSLIYFGAGSAGNPGFADGVWVASGSFDPNPLSAEITASPEKMVRGDIVTLTAIATAEAGRTIQRVEWYEDTNRNGVFDVGADKSAGQSTPSPTGLARFDLNTLRLPIGTNRYFARFLYGGNERSTAITGTFEVSNAAPTMTGVKASKTFLKTSTERLSVSGLGAKDVDGKIDSISFYFDSDRDGSFNIETDQAIGATPARRPTSLINVPSALLRVGDNRIFGICRDNDGAQSVVVSTVVRVNAAPTIQSVTFTPSSGSRLTTTFEFAARGVVDTDNGVRSVEFWIDSNNNGVLDRSDRKLGTAKLVGDAWRLTLKPRTLAIGEYRIIGSATDRLGLVASIVTQDRLTVVA